MKKASHVSLLLAVIGFLLAALGTQLLARRLYARQHQESMSIAAQPGYQLTH